MMRPGRIVNSHPSPRALLARFGRSAAAHRGRACGGKARASDPRAILIGMTDRDLKEIEERLNALSRLVCAIADKVKLDDAADPFVSIALSDIRFELHLDRK